MIRCGEEAAAATTTVQISTTAEMNAVNTSAIIVTITNWNINNATTILQKTELTTA
jgi:hypothetical protein